MMLVDEFISRDDDNDDDDDNDLLEESLIFT
jgi:hypothetical protein